MSAHVLDRMADKFTVGDGCWEWTGVLSAGYGQIWLDGRMQGAHRVLYEIMVGPIPDGLQIDHLCRNRKCIRPGHLEPVTGSENLRRIPAGIMGKFQRSKTECSEGHPYSDMNTYRYPDGRRACRICRVEWQRAYRRRREAA